MKKTINLKIDVTKIDKDRLFNGKKGTYLDAVLLYDSEDDQYGNNGVIIQSVSKQERDNGVKGNILGNGKEFGNNNAQPQQNQQQPSSNIPDDVDNDLPF